MVVGCSRKDRAPDVRPLVPEPSVPQPVPSATMPPMSVHTAVPVLQDKAPVWQGFTGGQLDPGMQAAHVPVWQN